MTIFSWVIVKLSRMELIKGNSINGIQLELFGLLLNSKNRVSPRGMATLEISPVLIELSNPRNRITSLKDRAWKLPLALGELSWNLSSSINVGFLRYYAKNWEQFATNNIIRESCYGNKIFGHKNQGSYWNKVKYILKDDRNSRRAIISLNNNDVAPDSKDVSCISSIQFMIRNGNLDLHVNMRSNDVYWGLPYDIFLFTFLQELMAIELDIPIGKYYHYAASMHIYERHIPKIKQILNTNIFSSTEMPHIGNPFYISNFLQKEKTIRLSKCWSEIERIAIPDDYWNDLLTVLKFYKAKKLKIAYQMDSRYNESMVDRYPELLNKN